MLGVIGSIENSERPAVAAPDSGTPLDSTLDGAADASWVPSGASLFTAFFLFLGFLGAISNSLAGKRAADHRHRCGPVGWETSRPQAQMLALGNGKQVLPLCSWNLAQLLRLGS